MQPSRRHCLYALLALLAISLPGSRTHAEGLTITSSPSGATVEINGSVAGTTPYTAEFPGGYFHKTHTVFGARLEHSMVARISKDGYRTQQINLTDGPFEWVAVTGRHHGSYFLLKSGRFDIRLESISHGDGNAAESTDREAPLRSISTSTPSVRADDSTSNAANGSVTIASDPPGAEIFVDGKFVGQTPSTIHLASGSHRVEVRSQGKRGWERDLEVLKDSQLTLHPVLESP
ncbi:MAG TPA: PEGA domain-containing protein [Candidatus Acidoferrales bacterium]|nr:PEGA domain-containing protein [Candidatus Acidoferrales bacterium]